MKCRRCNRQLKREPYRTLGIGKICKAKEDADRERQQYETGDVIIPYDGGDIFIERLASPTYNDQGQLTLMQHSCSGIKTNVQRIETVHSPSGFNFGYGGSGPADFALNVLLMLTDKETAHSLYQEFKWKYIAVGDEVTRLVIPRTEILKFIEDSKKPGDENVLIDEKIYGGRL